MVAGDAVFGANVSQGQPAPAITLTNAANWFSGAVSVNTSGSGDIQLTNSTATVMTTSFVGGNLTIASGGTISQKTGARIILTNGGSTTFALTAPNSDIL